MIRPTSPWSRTVSRRGESSEVPGILFLDRDGVLNVGAPEGEYVTDVAQLRLLPDVGPALAAVRRSLPSMPIVVVTNQRGVARGLMTAAILDAINVRLLGMIRDAGGDIDAFEVCPHEIGSCDCRKPAPGMLLRALARHPGVSAADSVVVGDSVSDLQAGAAIGARTALVGPEARRISVRAAAARLEVPVHAEADSLAALVDSGQLLGLLRETPVAS